MGFFSDFIPADVFGLFGHSAPASAAPDMSGAFGGQAFNLGPMVPPPPQTQPTGWLANFGTQIKNDLKQRLQHGSPAPNMGMPDVQAPPINLPQGFSQGQPMAGYRPFEQFGGLASLNRYGSPF